MCERWFLTVCWLRPNCWPMSLLLDPSTMAVTICSSRFVSRPAGVAPRLASRLGAPQLLDDVLHALVADPVLAVHHAVQALEQQLRGRFLEDHAAGAETQRLHRLGRVDRRRQQHRSDRQAEFEEVLERLEAVGSRHRQVEQQHVGAERRRLRDRLVTVSRLADDFESRFRAQQSPQPVPEDRVIVRDDDPDRCRVVQPWCLLGTLISSLVPKPGWLWIDSCPLMDRVRSLMITGPFRCDSTSSGDR